MKKLGRLFIISGTSQVGKSTIAKKLTSFKKLRLKKIVTTTTRARRPDDRVATYNFVTKKKFHSLIRKQEFLEWAKVHTDYYGTPENKVIKTLNNGFNVVLVIDVQGAKQIKKIMPQAVTIFIKAESNKELKRRIFESKHIPENKKAARWNSTKLELKSSNSYDYVVINKWGKLNQAVNNIKRLILKHQPYLTRGKK